MKSKNRTCNRLLPKRLAGGKECVLDVSRWWEWGHELLTRAGIEVTLAIDSWPSRLFPASLAPNGHQHPKRNDLATRLPSLNLLWSFCFSPPSFLPIEKSTLLLTFFFLSLNIQGALVALLFPTALTPTFTFLVLAEVSPISHFLHKRLVGYTPSQSSRMTLTQGSKVSCSPEQQAVFVAWMQV